MPLSPSLLRSLGEVVGAAAVLAEPEDVIPFGFDGTAALRQRPGGVVFPHTTDEVVRCVRVATEHRVPIVTRGSGTGLSGGSVPGADSLVLCLVRMNAILEVDARNLTIRAQPGVITQKIDEAAGVHGLFYPPDPGSMRVSTIGGNVAENSGGLRGLKYGVTRDYVLGLEVVLPDGRVARLGNKCVKDVAGYSLKDLFIGSEGTLGIITEVLLKLLPRPAARRTMLALYDRIEDAAETVSAIIAARIIPCTLEFLDRMTTRCVEEFAHVGLPDRLRGDSADGDRRPSGRRRRRGAAHGGHCAGARRSRRARRRATRRRPSRWRPHDAAPSRPSRVSGRRPFSRTSPCPEASWPAMVGFIADDGR